MDAARGVWGHGWPLAPCPRSDDAAREVWRSQTWMQGQALWFLSAIENRHRGRPSGRAPATPPGMRVRTGRFEKLRSAESR